MHRQLSEHRVPGFSGKEWYSCSETTMLAGICRVMTETSTDPQNFEMVEDDDSEDDDGLSGRVAQEEV